MTWVIIAVLLTFAIIAAVCAYAYCQLEPIRPDSREVTDEQVAEIICGTGTEAPRRGV